MRFVTLAYVMAVAGALLGLRFVFRGASVLTEWGIAPTPGALIVCRRLGALYLGLALTFYLGRHAPPAPLRSALTVGVGSAIAMLACLGVYELAVGRATTRILVSVGVEALLAACFVYVEWRGR